MVTVNNALIETLKTALGMEQKSYAYYMEAADRAHISIVESVLRNLAQDEVAHKQIIERFYKAIGKSHGWPEVDFSSLDTRSGEERFNQIVSQSKIEFTPDSSFDDVYIFAYDREVHSRDFYIEQRNANTDDHELNRFFDFLANMESVHMKMLDLLVQSSKGLAEK